MQLLFGEEGVWEGYTPSLSPLQALKSVPDPLDVLLGIPEPWHIHARSPFESASESESDSGSDDNSFSSMSAFSPTSQEHHIPRDIPPSDWGATKTFARLEDNALGLDFASQMRAVEARAVATFIPQAESLRAPEDHQDVHGRERPNQKCHAPRRHATPQPYVTASETLVVRRLQATSLQGKVSDASGSKKSQGSTSPRYNAHPYGRVAKARRNYGPDDWLSSGEPKKRADHDDALSTCAVYAEESDNKPSRARLMRTVALPDDKETSNAASEKLLYSGPDLGGWLTGTLDGVPKTLDHLSFALPVPFPAGEVLLDSPRSKSGKHEYGLVSD